MTSIVIMAPCPSFWRHCLACNNKTGDAKTTARRIAGYTYDWGKYFSAADAALQWITWKTLFYLSLITSQVNLPPFLSLPH